jgi:hypothetical protein
MVKDKGYNNSTHTDCSCAEGPQELQEGASIHSVPWQDIDSLGGLSGSVEKRTQETD